MKTRTNKPQLELDLAEEIDVYVNDIIRLETERQTLQRRLAEALKDSDRLDYLEAHSNKEGLSSFPYKKQHRSLREAIDVWQKPADAHTSAICKACGYVTKRCVCADAHTPAVPALFAYLEAYSKRQGHALHNTR